MRNRTKLLAIVFVALMTAAAIAVGAVWFQRPTVLTIAVAPGPERQFADKMAALLEQTRSPVRFSVMAADSPVQALAHFARHEADLAIMRTDMRVPPQARSIAVLDDEILLVVAPKAARLRNIADLRGRKLAILGEDGRNESMVRQILNQYDIDPGKTRMQIQTFPPGRPVDQLLAIGYDAVLTFSPRSWVAKSSAFDQLSHGTGGFTLIGVGESKALERKIPGLFSETIEAGLLAGDPRIPDEDLSTVSLQRMLIARSKVTDQAVVAVMRLLFENKADLSVSPMFATHIEPPDTDKDALITAHDGAVEYLDSEEKSFFDRYSDIIYLTMSIGSIGGSLAIALFSSFTRVKPRKAGEAAHEVMQIIDRIRDAADEAELDIAETALEDELRGILRGLKDGTVSSDGLDAFRLAYEHAREALSLRRHKGKP